MNNNVEALKNLYIALGGEAEAVANCNTSVDVLNAIAEKFDGEGGANLNPVAIDNIAAVAENITGGGGGAGDYRTVQVTINAPSADLQHPIDLFVPFIFNGRLSGRITVLLNIPTTYEIVLYKDDVTCITDTDVASVSGNIEMASAKNLTITGDGTINFALHD